MLPASASSSFGIMFSHLKLLLLVSSTQGWADTVLWNPYGNEAMGAKKFICVESGNVKDAVTVAPKGTWVGEMSLGIVDLFD